MRSARRISMCRCIKEDELQCENSKDLGWLWVEVHYPYRQRTGQDRLHSRQAPLVSSTFCIVRHSSKADSLYEISMGPRSFGVDVTALRAGICSSSSQRAFFSLSLSLVVHLTLYHSLGESAPPLRKRQPREKTTKQEFIGTYILGVPLRWQGCDFQIKISILLGVIKSILTSNKVSHSIRDAWTVL